MVARQVDHRRPLGPARYRGPAWDRPRPAALAAPVGRPARLRPRRADRRRPVASAVSGSATWPRRRGSSGSRRPRACDRSRGSRTRGCAWCCCSCVDGRRLGGDRRVRPVAIGAVIIVTGSGAAGRRGPGWSGWASRCPACYMASVKLCDNDRRRASPASSSTCRSRRSSAWSRSRSRSAVLIAPRSAVRDAAFQVLVLFGQAWLAAQAEPVARARRGRHADRADRPAELAYEVFARVRSGRERQSAAGVTAAFAPGRANLIGEHTDYNQGLALPFAIERGVTARVAGAAGSGPPDPYVRGVLSELGLPADTRVEIESDLPSGGGLSSSAALTLAVAIALRPLPADPRELARWPSASRRRTAGADTGLLDQLAILLGRAGLPCSHRLPRPELAPRAARAGRLAARDLRLGGAARACRLGLQRAARRVQPRRVGRRGRRCATPTWVTARSCPPRWARAYAT